MRRLPVLALLLPLAAPLHAQAARVTITGERLTQGDAVRCPQVRDDAGRVHDVSHLSPAVAIGDRVAVTGRYVVSTRCLGTVLIVEEEVGQD